MNRQKEQIEKELRAFKRKTGSHIIITKELAKILEDLKIDPDTYYVTRFL